MNEEVIPLVVGILETNCYLVGCGTGKTGVIIDPGDESQRIIEQCKATGIKPEMILLTHGHIDHTNAAGELRDYFGCTVLCHALDEGMVASAGSGIWGLERRPCQVDRTISDGEVVTVGGIGLEVIHTPGHTKGSVCFKLDRILFSGDTLFRGSIGRTDLPGGSEEEIFKSLKQRLAMLDPDIIVYPGHGPSTTIGYERAHNPFLTG